MSSIEFRWDERGWRPRWGELVGMVERCAHGEEDDEEEQRWLRAHPLDWLMAARHLRTFTENQIAETRKDLSRIVATSATTGRTTTAYLKAKRDADVLNRRRMHWMALVDEQIAEAKYLLGYDRLPADNRAYLLERLLKLRAVLFRPDFTPHHGMDLVDSILKEIVGENYNPMAYRPPLRAARPDDTVTGAEETQ